MGMRVVYRCLKCCLYGLLLSFGANAAGQSSCVFFQVGAAAAAPGETVRLPVSARAFQEMLIYQFPIVWNPADLQFIRTDMTGSPLQYMSFGATNAAAGQLRCVWYDFDVEGVSVPDDATLFTLEFKVLAGAPGFYPVSLAPQIPGFAFEILQTSGPQLPLLHKVGGVQVGGLPVSDLQLDAFCAQSGFCNTLAGGLNTGISGGVPPYIYAWTGPNGYTSADADPANLQAGEYALTVSDQNGQTLVSGASILPLWSGLSVWADSIGMDWCDQASGCALIRTSGGNPPYQWLWPDGATWQSRCDLASGNYAVTVTDASGCSRMVQFYVPGESKLKVETQLTYADCRSGQYGAASVTALNGLAPFTYQWSNGAQSATIDQVTGGKYTVTVTDAAGCQTTTSTEVKDYGTLDWSVYLSAQCTKDTVEAPGYVKLNGYDFETRAAYPLTLQWSTGTRDIVAEYQSDSLGGLNFLPNGRYSVTVSDSDGCTAEVSDFADCRLTPPALTHLNTRFYLDNKTKNGGIDSCIDVRVLDFTNLDTVHFSLDWKYAKFREVKNFATPVWKTGITAANFKTGNSEMEFSWKAPASQASGLTLFDDSRLFTVCFTKTISNSDRIEFVEGDTPPLVRDKSGKEHGFIGKNGHVRFEGTWYYWETVDRSFNLSLPNCEQDGFARIELKPAYNFPYLFLDVKHNGILYDNTDFGKINFAAPGNYYISLASGNNNSSFYAYVPPAFSSGDCVWPGDADNNNAVNHFDLLYAGLAMGQNGPERVPASEFWTGQAAGDWPFSSPARFVNGKNMDANGDGLVDAADTAAIGLNWTKVLNIYQDNPFAASVPLEPVQNGLPLLLQTDTLPVGDPVSLPLLFGLPDHPVENIHGLAFSLVYDPEMLEGEVFFEPLASWLGNPAAGLICMQRNFPGQRRLDVALSRTDGQPAGGQGVIGRIWFSPKSPENNEPLPPLQFYLTHAAAITPSEIWIPLNGPAATVPLKPGPVSHAGTAPGLSGRVSVWPNPVQETFRIVSGLVLEMVEIVDAAGRIKTIATGNTLIHINDLPEGPYLLRITTNEGVACKRIVVIR